MFATQYGFVFLSVGTLLVPSIENFTDRQDLKSFFIRINQLVRQEIGEDGDHNLVFTFRFLRPS
jgi:hypothetical protein